VGLGREGEITDTHLDVHGLLVGLELAACKESSGSPRNKTNRWMGGSVREGIW